MPQSNHKLYYWPLPFRGCFISYLFAYTNTPLLQESSYEAINHLKDLPPPNQPIPFIGPPILQILDTNQYLSQMPAITLYVSKELNLQPTDPIDLALAMKVLMDCNDLLMEICRYNGTSMWQRDEWVDFRSKRLPHWCEIFEESLNRGFMGKASANFADIGVYALFGNMLRCLPELEPDVLRHAPGVHAHCQRIGSQPSLADFVAGQEAEYSDLYCGGQIEASIREMLALDAAG